MRQNSPIAAFTARKRTEKFQDASPKKSRQCNNSAELNDDAVHLPEAILQINVQQRFRDAEMRGRTYGEKLRQAFNRAEKNREKVIIHRPPEKAVAGLDRVCAPFVG